MPKSVESDGQDVRAFVAVAAVALLPTVIGRLEWQKGLEGEQEFRKLVEDHLGGVFESLTAHGPDVFASVGGRLLVFELKTSEHFPTADKESQSRKLGSKLKPTQHGRQGTAEHTNRHVQRLLDRADRHGDEEALEQAVQILQAFDTDCVSHFAVAINPLEKSFDVYPLEDDGRPAPLPSRLW